MQMWTADMIKESDEDHQARCTNCIVLNSIVVVAIKDWKERFRCRLPRKKLIYNNVYKTVRVCVSYVLKCLHKNLSYARKDIFYEPNFLPFRRFKWQLTQNGYFNFQTS